MPDKVKGGLIQRCRLLSPYYPIGGSAQRRQCVGVLDEGQCTCQIRGHDEGALLATPPTGAPERHQMKKPTSKPTEQKCPACNGTGFP